VSLRQLFCFVAGHVPVQVVMARGGNVQYCACCGRCLSEHVRHIAPELRPASRR